MDKRLHFLVVLLEPCVRLSLTWLGLVRVSLGPWLGLVRVSLGPWLVLVRVSPGPWLGLVRPLVSGLRVAFNGG